MLRNLHWSYEDDVTYTAEQIKEVLATREHIPNKKEAKLKRQLAAKRKK